MKSRSAGRGELAHGWLNALTCGFCSTEIEEERPLGSEAPYELKGLIAYCEGVGWIPIIDPAYYVRPGPESIAAVSRRLDLEFTSAEISMKGRATTTATSVIKQSTAARRLTDNSSLVSMRLPSSDIP